MNIWSVAGSAALSALNQLFNNSSSTTSYNRSLSMMDKQAELNKNLFDYSFNTTANYNSPSNVMSRLDNAGLNPNLAYGSVSGENNVGSASGVGLGSSSSFPSSFASDFSSALNSFNQERVLSSQANANDAAAAKSFAEADAISGYQSDESRSRVDLNKSLQGYYKAYSFLADAETKLREIDLMYSGKMYRQQLELGVVTLDLSKFQRDVMNEQNLKTVVLGLNKLAAEISVLNSQSSLNYALGVKTESEALLNAYEVDKYERLTEDERDRLSQGLLYAVDLVETHKSISEQELKQLKAVLAGGQGAGANVWNAFVFLLTHIFSAGASASISTGSSSNTTKLVK